MPPRVRRPEAFYRKYMVEPEDDTPLGRAKVVRNSAAHRRIATANRIPVITIRIDPRHDVEEELINVENSTQALVLQALNQAYGMALEAIHQDAAPIHIHPGDRVSIWLEIQGFDRTTQVRHLATNVPVDAAAIRGTVRANLQEILEYEAGRVGVDVVGDARSVEVEELRDAMDDLGFNFDRFDERQVGGVNHGELVLDRTERGTMLEDFMAGHTAEEMLDLPHSRRIGWFQLRTYFNRPRMAIYFTFFLHTRMPGPPGGWKDGVRGITPAQIYRFGDRIPFEVTKDNDLCLFLAVEFATTFTFDRKRKEMERSEFFIPRSKERWAVAVDEGLVLRTQLDLDGCDDLKVMINALSLHHSAVIHVFDYASGSVEVQCSSEDVRDGLIEKHKVIMIADEHAYPVTKPHFIVQDASKPKFCPVCFHCFKNKRDLFYHIERCSRESSMDSIDYTLRRRFEKRSYVGKKYHVGGGYYRKCMGCAKIGLDVREPIDGKPQVHFDEGGNNLKEDRCQCAVPEFDDLGRKFQVVKCMLCNIVFPTCDSDSHKCRMQVREERPLDLSKIWVYDIESQLDTDIGEVVDPLLEPIRRFSEASQHKACDDEGDGDPLLLNPGQIQTFRVMQQQHKPNLVVMMPLISQVEGSDDIRSFGSIAEFLDEVYSDDMYKGGRFYAHNAGRYDTHFIVSELIQRGCIPTFVPGSSAGYTNMLLVSFNERSFADSYRLFPQGLAALARSFNLEVQKGRFPYRFNCARNQGYCGPLPNLEWFDPGDTRGGLREMEELIVWHSTETDKYRGGTWNLADQLYLYCVDDVKILKEIMIQGVGLFQTIFSRTTRTFDGWRAPTISLTNHLTLTSAVVGACLYGLQDKCRFTLRDVDDAYMDADRFYDMVLAYEYKFKNHQEIHVVPELGNMYRGYEVLADDGDLEIRVFLDCFRCGCRKCYPMKTIVVAPNTESFGDLWEQVLVDQVLIPQQLGVDVSRIRFIWGHEYTEMFEQVDPELQDQLSAVLDPYIPIRVRDAMFGGHTEAGALYAESYGIHKICKIDVNSMYPFVCAELELPFGDPETLRMEEVDRAMFDRREYFGLVRAQFRPPKDLLFPILPRKCGKTGKLVFDCTDRVGTYTTVDVYHAMDLGYEVGDIYEIRHFPPSQRKAGLFREYVLILYDVKAQAKVDNNPALYLLCKFALNSLWGKFGEKVHMSYQGFVSSLRGYSDFMHAETIRDGSREMIEVADNIYLVKAKYETVVCDAPRYYHPELACFVLAHARKILHSAIYALGPGRFLYCDTDSIIYMHTLNQNTPPIGDALGEWDIEVNGWPERYIKKFYSCGPKAYCEVYSDGTHKVCYKGVMGSVHNKNILRPETFHELVLNYLRNKGGSGGRGESMTMSTQDFSIRVQYKQNGEGVHVRSNYSVKRIRVVNEKRYVPDMFGAEDQLEGLVMVRTLPYGFALDPQEHSYVTRDQFSRDFSY